MIKNPVRRTRKKHLRPPPLDGGKADHLVERLRDARARVRLGLPLVEELDMLLDQAAECLENAADIASAVKAHEHGHYHGELVWVPKEVLFDVLELIEDEDEDDREELAAAKALRERSSLTGGTST